MTILKNKKKTLGPTLKTKVLRISLVLLVTLPTKFVVAEDYDLRLDKNQVAPFNGILVPLDLYKYYRAESDIEEKLSKDVSDMYIEDQELRSPSVWPYLLTMGLGMAFGYCASHVILQRSCFK